MLYPLSYGGRLRQPAALSGYRAIFDKRRANRPVGIRLMQPSNGLPATSFGPPERCRPAIRGDP